MLLEIFSDANFIHSEPFLMVCKYEKEKLSSARVWFTLHCFYEVFTVSAAELAYALSYKPKMKILASLY